MSLDIYTNKKMIKPYKISLDYKSPTSKDEGIEKAEAENLVTL